MFGNKVDKIAKLAQKGDGEKLAGFVGDKKEEVRLAAIDALGKCEGDVPFNALVPLVHTGDVQTRIHAVTALAALKQPRARTFIEHQRTLERDPAIQKALDEALGSIKDDEN